MQFDIISYAWIVIQILIGYNLFIPFLLFVLYKLFTKSSPQGEVVSYDEPDYAIIVTAFEQTDLLPSVVSSILKVNYTNFLVYIVADKCDISTLIFEDKRVIVLRPEQILASNTRSHFYAINRFQRPHDRLTIIDSDNLVHPDFLTELNVFFERGFSAVQGIREAKNLDTTYSRLDAARDIYYHFYDGKVLFGLGSSATLAGSGMAFKTSLYRECLEHLDITGAGFDKVLQYQILSRNMRIAFAEKAVVYDEKTSMSDQLVKQRSRWINTWFKYFGYGFKLIGKGLINLSWNQLLFGIILLRPPLFIFLILSLISMGVDLFVCPVAAGIWFTGFILFVTSFIIALSGPKTDKRIKQSLISIPKFVYYQVISLLNARNANKKSIATRHRHIDGEHEN
jgi:cellulose synthase/poly-beta-1,6-N-acetylglucosamine synthase-like glycosyltransferase